MAEEPLSVTLGCPTCTVTIDPQGQVSHESNCLQQKHNKLKDAVVAALKSLGDAIGGV
jgi:hypothetical protein